MQFSIATVLAFASAVFAQRAPTEGFNAIVKPTEGENVPAGSTYKIEWQFNDAFPGSVSIDLLGGSKPSTLAVVDSIATGVDATDESYDWEVPEELGDLATYGIMITLESDAETFQYGFPFHITPADDSDSDDDETSTSAAVTATETETSAEPTTEATSTSSFTVAPTTMPSNSTATTSSSDAAVPTTTGGTTVVEEEPTAATTTPPLITNGAASMAGSFAMLGGVAMAVLAL